MCTYDENDQICRYWAPSLDTVVVVLAYYGLGLVIDSLYKYVFSFS